MRGQHLRSEIRCVLYYIFDGHPWLDRYYFKSFVSVRTGWYWNMLNITARHNMRRCPNIHLSTYLVTERIMSQLVMFVGQILLTRPGEPSPTEICWQTDGNSAINPYATDKNDKWNTSPQSRSAFSRSEILKISKEECQGTVKTS